LQNIIGNIDNIIVQQKQKEIFFKIRQ